MKTPPLTGRRYGHWAVGKWVVCNEFGFVYSCTCDCGNVVSVQGANLVNGKSTKCRRCANTASNRAKTAWRGYRETCPDTRLRRHLLTVIGLAIRRCTNPASDVWKYYGGRGIRVHDAWVQDRNEFLKYLVTLPGHDNYQLTVDRIDNDGNYEPGNLRFATKLQQSQNQRPRRKKAVIQ